MRTLRNTMRTSFQALVLCALSQISTPLSAGDSPAPRAEMVSLLPHSGSVNAVALSPEGRLLATGAEDFSIKLWDPATGQMLHTFPAQGGPVFDLTFSPDGRWLASASFDGFIQVWHVDTRALAYRITQVRGAAYGVSFSPDSGRLAVTSRDRAVRLFTATNGTLLQAFSDLTQPTAAVRFNTDGSLLAAGSTEGFVAVWDTAKGELKHKWSHGRPVLALTFAQTNQLVGGGGLPFGLRFWDVTSGAQTDLQRFRQTIRAIQPLDDDTLAVAQDAFVYLRRAASGQILRILQQRAALALDLAASSNGLLCVGRSDATVDVWNWREGKLLRVLNDPPRPPLPFFSEDRRIAFSPDGRLLASTFEVQQAQVWDAETMLLHFSLAHPSGALGELAFSPDGQFIATAGEDRVVRLWNAGDGREVRALRGHTEPVKSVAFSHDGNLLASGAGNDETESTQDHSIRLWRPQTGELVRELRGQWRASISSLAFHPNSKLLLSVERLGPITLWDVETGEALRTLNDKASRSARFSPDGKLFTASQAGRIVRLYDTASQKILATFNEHQHNTTLFAFSPDGRWIASGSVDGSVRFWETATFAPGPVFESGAGQVLDVAFHPTLSRVACVTTFNACQIWDTATGRQIYQRMQPSQNEWIGFNPQTLRYHSSANGDEFAGVRFGGELESVYPLSFYRDALREENAAKVLADTSAPALSPKPSRLAWKRFTHWSDVAWLCGALVVGALVWTLWSNWRLQQRRAAQAAFSRSLIHSQETERKRIAAELHDGIGHQLLIIKNQAVLAVTDAQAGRNVNAALEEISRTATQSIEETRQISHNLRPFQIDRLGLTRALQSMARDFSRTAGIDFHAEVAALEGALPAEQEINLYRVVQESLNNISRHSGAARASLSIQRTATSVAVLIEDDGRGFDPARVGQPGHGLSNMYERVRLLGGMLRCDSSPGEGTKLSFDLPANPHNGAPPASTKDVERS